MNSIVEIPDIGKVSIRSNRRIKNLSIKMAPTKGIWVNIPFGTDKKLVLDFIQKHKAWILKNKQKIEQKEQRQTVFTPDTVFRTKFHQLKMLPKATGDITAKIKNSELILTYPQTIDILEEGFQQTVRNIVIEVLRIEAQNYLPKRLCQLAEKYRFQFNKVSIRNSKAQWGACSATNNISLSLHLMRLPDHLIDMVLIHELCHTIEKNHSSKFWQLHAKCCSNLEAKKQELKQYSTNIL